MKTGKVVSVLKSTCEYLMYFAVGYVIVWGLNKYLIITLLTVSTVVYAALCYGWNISCRRYTATKYLHLLRLSSDDTGDQHNLTPYAFYTQEINTAYKKNCRKYRLNTEGKIFTYTYDNYEYLVLKSEFDLERILDRAQEYHKGLFYAFHNRTFTRYSTMKAVLAGKFDFKLGL